MKRAIRILAALLTFAMLLGILPVMSFGAEEGSVSSYDDFLSNLEVLEGYANEFSSSNSSYSDPNLLMINFLRTGVDRYLDGNWSTLAGKEITTFTDYVREQDAANGTTAMALRNLNYFTLPNGNSVDFGHMFGAMNIAYVAAVQTGDLGGWAGDICDLLLFSYYYGNVPEGSVEEMAAYVLDNCFGVDAEDAFGMDDFFGDMDAYYLNSELKKGATLYALCEAYFTESLDDVSRAEYFMNNRFKGMGLETQEDVRKAVYDIYCGNIGLQVLEADRGLSNQHALREACCYAFADYLFTLAGDRLNTGVDQGGEGGNEGGNEGGGNEGGGNEGGGNEGGGEGENPGDTPEASNPYYSVFSSEESTLAPGITQTIKYALTVDSKQLAYYIATVDINRDDVNIYANYKNNDPSSGWGMQRVFDQMAAAQAKHSDPKDTENYIENYYTVVGVNGDFYNMSTGKPSGALVMEGVTYSPGNGRNFFGILADGTPVIATGDQWNTYKDQLVEAIGGSIMLVQDGRSVAGTTPNYAYTRASRTCIGITEDGKVVLMVLDGRQEPFSAGGSYEELAQIMMDAGCVTAMNLDGGGSTTFAAKQEGSDEVTVINRPSDGYQRSVASSLVVVSTAKPSTEFDHAVISSDYEYLTVGTSLTLSAKGVSNTGYAATIPDGASWAISDPSIATITPDGVLTALENGDVQAQIVANGQVIGSLDLHVVIPNGVAVAEVIKAVYGVPSEVPFQASYDGNPVAVNDGDFIMGVVDENAGYFDGYHFIGNAESGLRRVTAAVVSVYSDELGAFFELHLFHADEATFDFDDITGGDRTLAWKREISNTETYDNVTYTVVDPQGTMDISYSFGLDMEAIEIPEQLADLTFMLPGADTGATAWDFLLQLAERISVLTEVRVVAKFDPNLEVDVSGVTVNNDYFALHSKEFDASTNTLTIICKWIDQTQAIDPATANPICVLTGIKAKTKDNAAWTPDEKLPIINEGVVSYKIYLRSNALYSFAEQPSNQEKYSLHPFENTDVIIGGSTEKGAYFEKEYASFADRYTLDKQLRQGWYNFDSQLFYFVDHVALTGAQQVPSYEDPSVKRFYLFDENGGSQGPITGLFEYQGNKYYAVLGELMTGWRSVSDFSGKSDYYYFDSTGKAVDGVCTIGGHTYTFEDHILVRGEIYTDATGSRYYWAGSPLIGQWIDVDDDTYYATYPKGYFATGMLYVRTPEGDVYQRYIFDEDGLFRKDITGLYHVGKDTYYAEEGHIIDEPGLVYVDGYYYYFCSTAKAVKNCRYWISVTNNLLPEGYFHFDEQGRMTDPPEIKPDEPMPELLNGIIENGGELFYYVNGKICYAAGLIQLLDGGIIYVRSGGQLARGMTYWTTNTNGLLPEGNYVFGDDGRMVNPPTIYYTITWVVEDTETSVRLPHSAMPVYNNGVDPSKDPDDSFCYEFIGWSPDVVPVVGDATYTASFMVKAHSGQTTTVDATCTDPGSITIICAHCGTVMSEENIPATGHVNTETVTVEPTCTENGTITVTCSCGEVVSVEIIDALGHSYESVVTAPTCTADGYTTYTCSVCGNVYTADPVPATGHVNTTATAVEATCTENGSVTITCACGEVVSVEIVDALGHSYESVVTAPTCTENGYTTYTCSKCGDSYTGNPVAATGHSYTYTNNGENHSVGCSKCDYSATEDHTYVDGACICGAVEGPIPASDLKFINKSLSLQSYIAFNVVSSKSALSKYESWYVVFERYDYEKNEVVTQTVEGTVYMNNYWQFEYKLNSYHMSDTVTATLYGVKEGKTYVGETYVNSAADYVIGSLPKATSDAHRKVFADLLTYGAKAQIYMGYNVEKLADADLGEYASFVTTTIPTAESIFAQTDKGLTGVTLGRMALGIASSVELQAILKVSSGYVAEDLYAEMVYVSGGKTMTQRIEGENFQIVGGGICVAVFNALTATDGRTPVEITVYDAEGNAISETWTYSIASYLDGTKLTGNALNTLYALINFYDSAATYYNG